MFLCNILLICFFFYTGGVSDHKRSGRLHVAHMPLVIKTVRSRINRNPVQKQKIIAREMDIAQIKLCSKIDHGYSNRILQLRIRPKLCNSDLEIMYLNLLVVTINRHLAQILIHLTTVLEGMVCTRLHRNLESLKQVLVEAGDSFPMDVIRTAINEWPNRHLGKWQ